MLRSETTAPLPAFFATSQADGEELAHPYSGSRMLFPRSAHPPGFLFVLQTTRTEGVQSQPCPGSAAVVSASLRHSFVTLQAIQDVLLPFAFSAQPFCDWLRNASRSPSGQCPFQLAFGGCLCWLLVVYQILPPADSQEDLLFGLLGTAGLCLFMTNSLSSSSSGGGL